MIRRCGGVGLARMVGVAGVAAIVGGVVSTRGVPTGHPIRTIAVGVGPSAVVVDHQSGHAFVANYTDATVSILDPQPEPSSTPSVCQDFPWPQLWTRPPVLSLSSAPRWGTYPPGGASGVLDTRTGALRRIMAVGHRASAVVADDRGGACPRHQ